MQSAPANFQKLCPIIATLLLLLSACDSADDRSLEESVEHVYPIESDAKIAVQNHDGAVVVYGSNANELRVRAVKKAYSRDRLNHITIEVSRAPGSVSIATKFPPQPNWALFDRSGTVDYTITVPATASIPRLELHSGEVYLEGMRGRETHARLGDGRIFARNCFTNLDLAMHRGTLTLSYDWWEEGMFSVRATVEHGNTSVFLPGDAAFHLLATVAHGRLSNDFNDLPVAEKLSPNRVKLDQLVNGGDQATIKMHVRQGNIKIVEANP